MAMSRSSCCVTVNPKCVFIGYDEGQITSQNSVRDFCGFRIVILALFACDFFCDSMKMYEKKSVICPLG